MMLLYGPGAQRHATSFILEHLLDRRLDAVQ